MNDVVMEFGPPIEKCAVCNMACRVARMGKVKLPLCADCMRDAVQMLDYQSKAQAQ